MNTQGRNSAFSTTYSTPSRHNKHFPISSPVVQSSSPSSMSSSSTRSYKRSFKERPTMNVAKVLHPLAPPQKKAKTGEESCLSGISPHSQPDRHVGESSKIRGVSHHRIKIRVVCMKVEFKIGCCLVVVIVW